MNELKIALAKLSATERTIKVFFRNDDVDVDEPTLRQLLKLFSASNIPLTLAVIPGRLTEACVALLNEFDRAKFELHQHGWQHVNHEPTGRKCEFGSSRSFDQQLKDISAGQQRMDEAFGQSWARVFTPPWNRCTEETYRALDQLGFAALSKDNSKPPVTSYTFRELSVTFDLYRWKGAPTMKTPEQVFSELAAQVNELDTIGIMLHHKVMDAAAFALLEELIETLLACPNAQFHTFQSLLCTQPPDIRNCR